MEKSEEIVDLMHALQLFRIKCGALSKNKSNPFYHSKYLSLDKLLEAIEEPLREADLVFTQMLTGKAGVWNMLYHLKTGQYIASTFEMEPIKQDPQAYGSLYTYARRYALVTMLGLNIEEDDDANKTVKPEKPWLNEGTETFNKAKEFVTNGGSISDIEKKYKLSKKVKAQLQ